MTSQRTASFSLSARLVIYLCVAQVCSVLIGMALWMGFSDAVTWDDVAAQSARSVIVSSIRYQPGGHLMVEQTAALLAYVASRPGFEFAVGDSKGTLLEGSSPALSAAVRTLGAHLPHAGLLDLRQGDGRLVLVGSEQTPWGELSIATIGNRMKPEDLSFFFSVYVVELLPILAAIALACVVVVPLAVRGALRPLQLASRRASELTFAGLDSGISRPDAPSELRPFLTAIDSLLSRLKAGMDAQRRFVANAAHELRTPAAILQARVELIPETPTILAARRDARRLSLLIDQLLASARLVSLSPAPRSDINLVMLLEDVVADCAPLAIRSGRTISLEVKVTSAAVTGTPDALRSAFANVIENALRAEPEGGNVTVQLDRTEDTVNVSIRDHGDGIPPEDRNRVFEPFWRKDESSPGSGLGLSIVREILSAHGGTVEVMQPEQGPGVIFTISLPGLTPSLLEAAGHEPDA